MLFRWLAFLFPGTALSPVARWRPPAPHRRARPQVECLEDRRVPAHYSILDLGTLGGAPTFVFGLDARGQASGSGTTAGGDTHGFIWQDGHMYDLGTLGGNFSEADLINDRGQVVGDSTTAAGESHFVVWSLNNGQVQTTDLGSLPGATAMLGLAINNRSQAVGEGDLANGDAHTVLADRTGLHDLHSQVTLGGASDSAYSINNAGQVVGVADTASLDSHAFAWDGHRVRDLGALAGTWSEALANNAAGQVVGTSGTDAQQHFSYSAGSGLGDNQPGLHHHAFLYSGGSMQDLGPVAGFTESSGEWVDPQGRAFGASETTQQDRFAATMWVNGRATDLNTLLVNPPASFLHLGTINWGNSRGRLVGVGRTTSGEIHSWLLTPLEDGDRDGDAPADATAPANPATSGLSGLPGLTTACAGASGRLLAGYSVGKAGEAAVPGGAEADASQGLVGIGGSATVNNSTIANNQAVGGAGGAGANGFGGGAYSDAPSSLTITGSTVTANVATGGAAGGGSAGLGQGGGLYLAAGGTGCLDAFTIAHVTGNHASTSDDDIFGAFTPCP
jgi:probable HAF family extracellular repeat protein